MEIPRQKQTLECVFQKVKIKNNFSTDLDQIKFYEKMLVNVTSTLFSVNFHP